MKVQTALSSALLLGLAGMAAAASRPATDSKTQGERLYRVYCASCHGSSGHGDGPVAEALKVRPTDLTRLREHGAFPADRIAAAIDGRQAIRGHGQGGMPVWGMSFQEPGRDSDQESQTREQIRDLVAYLESIQTKK